MEKRRYKLVLTLGIAVPVAVIVLACVTLCVFFKYLCSKKTKSTKDMERVSSLPIRFYGENASNALSTALQCDDQKEYVVAFRDLWNRGKALAPARISPNGRVIQFTYKELQKATENFTKVIGKGSFGPVYKAVLSSTEIVAVKVLSTSSNQGQKEFRNEIELLSRLHHRNLLRLVGYCSEKGCRILVYEYMSNGSLDARLQDEENVLSWDQRVAIAQGVARGIDYLHNGALPPVIHRDIKSSNILLDSCMNAKVADFGLSKETGLEMPASGIKGTHGYVDPEYISTNSLTCKSDVYSFGVLIFELIVGRSPREGLLEFVEEILIRGGGLEEWLEIVDARLIGKCDRKELGVMAMIATKCIGAAAVKRPRMQEVCQALSRLGPRSFSSRVLEIRN